jgi:hypothetical protein
MRSQSHGLALAVWRGGVGFAVLGVVLFLLAPCAARGADDSSAYRVRIVQPLKVGDRLHIQRDIEEAVSDTVTIGGGRRGREALGAMELKFSGRLEALEVDKHGMPTRWKVIAAVATVREPQTKSHEELVKPGTAFTVDWKGSKVAISPQDIGHPLSEAAGKFLPLVFEASGASGEASLDEIIQSSKAEPLGASWSINTKAAAENLRDFDAKLKPSDVTGTVRLKALVGDTDKKDLSVDYNFTAKSNNPANPPAGMKRLGAVTREESGTLIIPSDLSTGYFSAKTTIRITGTYKKMDNEKKSNTYKTGPRSTKTVTKDLKVPEDDAINRVIKINTLLIYERVGGVDRKPAASGASSARTGGELQDSAALPK